VWEICKTTSKQHARGSPHTLFVSSPNSRCLHSQARSATRGTSGKHHWRLGTRQIHSNIDVGCTYIQLEYWAREKGPVGQSSLGCANRAKGSRISGSGSANRSWVEHVCRFCHWAASTSPMTLFDMSLRSG